MIKKHLSILLFLFLAVKNPALANDFASTIHRTYTLTQTGANVSVTLTVTNLSDLVYPMGYSLFLFSEQLKDVTLVNQQNQPVAFNQLPVAGTTKIDIPFVNPVVGKHKSQTYRLEYTHSEIRPLPQSAQYFIEKPISYKTGEAVTTTVIIPKNICPTPVIWPETVAASQQDTFSSVSYNQPDTQTVAILCQPERHLDFEIDYQLANPTVTPAEIQIALPPDTTYQRIILHQLEPKPLRINPDTDGNRIATYKLEPRQSIDVIVSGSAILTNYTKPFKEDVTPRSSLTADQPMWPTSNTKIKQLAKQLPDAQAIFTYLVATANYNPDQFDTGTKRRGGLQIVDNPQDMSGEDFTDAFITLARSNGIMSRRIIGFVQTPNQKITPLEFPNQSLHVYPEWYQPETRSWIQVDPFWQKTNPHWDYWPITDKLRLALAINGQSDSLPFPTGTIVVTETEPFDLPTPTITARIIPSVVDRLLSGKYRLAIKNHSNYALYDESFTLTSDDGANETVLLSRLDMNSEGIIPITTTGKHLTLETNYGSIPIEQTHFLVSPTLAITGVVVAIAGFFTVITGRLLVHRQKR